MKMKLHYSVRVSLHSKSFLGVGEQRKTKERNRNGILPAGNWGESQNKKEGWGNGKKETLADKPLDHRIKKGN